MTNGSLISSNEIIDKTGFSETTLANFIILGILPKPIVKEPVSEEKDLEQNVFFPADVLDRIFNVKFNKKPNNSMKDIIEFFQNPIGAVTNL